MRIGLARLLLGPAGQSASTGGQGGLLLLDEPTNHLDRSALLPCLEMKLACLTASLAKHQARNPTSLWP